MSWMDLLRNNSEAIFGGHISGRRLRGVKVNPIYQENDVTRNGDTQSEGGVPVGEIQIEMYESLPRHGPVRHCRSAPVDSKGQANRRDKSGEQFKVMDSEELSRSRKKQLTRQKRYDLDLDVIEVADSPVSSSGRSSPAISVYLSSSKDKSSPRATFSKRPQLSTLSERTDTSLSTGSYEGKVTLPLGGEQVLYQHRSSSPSGQPAVTSLDIMNNNEMSMPDRMLQHYETTSQMSRLRAEVLSNESFLEEFSRSPHSIRPEDFILCDTLSLTAVFSNSSSVDSEYKTLDPSLAQPVKCECRGKPTLKCECGRAALQRIFREKGMTPLEDKDQHFQGHITQKSYYNIDTSVCHTEAQKKLLAMHALGQGEGKYVTFSEDTIFNEENRVTYVKECITRSVFHVPLDDNEVGYDNMGFVPYLTDDDKVMQLTKSGSCEEIDDRGSLVLSVSNLNTPAYLHGYILGFHHERDIQNSLFSQEIRAAPVSIEAIGGITCDDSAFDAIAEATDEDFEYYRRRRRKKKSSGNSEDASVEKWTRKTKRCRKIKISVIAVSVIFCIVTTIGLAIHFGAPALGNSSATSGQTQDTGIQRFFI